MLKTGTASPKRRHVKPKSSSPRTEKFLTRGELTQRFDRSPCLPVKLSSGFDSGGESSSSGQSACQRDVYAVYSI